MKNSEIPVTINVIEVFWKLMLHQLANSYYCLKGSSATIYQSTQCI